MSSFMHKYAGQLCVAWRLTHKKGWTNMLAHTHTHTYIRDGWPIVKLNSTKIYACTRERFTWHCTPLRVYARTCSIPCLLAWLLLWPLIHKHISKKQFASDLNWVNKRCSVISTPSFPLVHGWQNIRYNNIKSRSLKIKCYVFLTLFPHFSF